MNATVTQIALATKRYGFDVDNPDREGEPVRTPKRQMAFGSDDDGTWWARIRLHGDEGKVVEAALQATRDRLHDQARAAAKEQAEAEGRPATGSDADLGVEKIGWADAVVGMANSVLGTDAVGAEKSTRHAVDRVPGRGGVSRVILGVFSLRVRAVGWQCRAGR